MDASTAVPPHHVPVGVVWADRSGVCCHLCGRWFRSVSAHLAGHGWTRQRYLDAFGLEQGVDLECAETLERRAAGFRPRRTFEPAVRAGVAAGQELARSGGLAEHAAKAARGRRHPAQRRAKTLAALAGVSPEARAAGTRRRRRAEVEEAGRRAARGLGHDSVADLVVERLGRGDSLATVSREAGLHKDWLQRHLATVAPEVAGRLGELRTPPADRRMLAAVRLAGFDDLAVFLRVRRLDERRSVRAVALELGVSRSTLEAALHRHGVGRAGAGSPS